MEHAPQNDRLVRILAEAGRLAGLRERMLERLTGSLEGVSLNGHPERRLPGNLNLSFFGIEGERQNLFPIVRLLRPLMRMHQVRGDTRALALLLRVGLVAAPAAGLVPVRGADLDLGLAAADAL